MARPSTRRALKRAGLAPEPRPPRGPRRNRGVPPPPLVRLPGEPEEPPPIDFASLFGRTAPVEMEIGVGKARFLLTEAAAHKERDFFGIELQSEYARIAQAKADKLGLTNVRVVRLDGKAFVASRLAPASLDALHVFFPDPWPKKRHHKRRLVDASFARAAATALKPGAILRVASDHAEYWASMLEALEAEPMLARVPETETGPWTSGTDYELKFTKGGRPIGRGIWRRTA